MYLWNVWYIAGEGEYNGIKVNNDCSGYFNMESNYTVQSFL